MKVVLLITVCLMLSGCRGCKSEIRDNSNSETVSVNQPQHSVDGYQLNEIGWACYQGDLEELKKHLNEGRGLENCMSDDIYEFDAVFVAVYFGQKTILEYLIGKGEKVNEPYDEHGTTLLLIACRFNRTDLAKILLQAGANVNGAGDLGGHIQYPLMEAVQNNNFEMVKLLIDNGADTNIVDIEGISPLEAAEYLGSVEIIALLKEIKTVLP